ncbi:hypothetical protein Tco_1282321 [Tanacetum coccineum]
MEQESFKKQNVEEDKESEELKQCLEIVPDDGDNVTINATLLSTKSPTIVDYKIYKEGKKSYFQIIRADGKTHMYLTFGKMLKNIDREDLEVIWSIVKARFKKTEPVNYIDNLLLHNLKTMLEHHVEDNSMLFYLLVKKIYPLTNHTLHQMFNDVKLQVDYECEMAFELLRLERPRLYYESDFGWLEQGTNSSANERVSVEAPRSLYANEHSEVLCFVVPKAGLRAVRWGTPSYMKKQMAKLPILRAPIKGETLIMYLSAAEKAISLVVVPGGDKQMPIYFVGRALQSPEVMKVTASSRNLGTMNPIAAQQVTLDNALVAPENRVHIGQCNMKINPTKTPKEPMYQVVLDSLALSPLYPAFLITAEVSEIYMHQLPTQDFDAPLSDEEIITFINKLGHKGACLGKLQIDNRDTKKQEKTYYPRITKAIIHHFISKDKSISMRNRIFMHIVRDDSILGSLIFVSKSDKYQVYGALLPEGMTNQKMQDSPAYKTYLAFATGAETPKKERKFRKPASPSKKKALVAVKEPAKKTIKKPAARRQSASVQIRDTPGVSVSKMKAPAKAERSKGIELLSEAASLEEAQLKKAIKRSKHDTSIHQAGGSSEGADLELEVPDEPKGNDDDNDDEDQQSDDARTESNDDDKAVDLNNTDDEEEDEFVHTPDDDVNVELKDSEHECEGKDDEDMTDAGHVDAEHKNVSQEVAGDQVKDYAQAIVISNNNHSSIYSTIHHSFSTTVVPDSETLFAIHLRVSDLEKEVKELKNVDHSSALHATIKSEVVAAVKEYLGTSLDDALYKALYHAFMESILADEDAMDKDVGDIQKKRKLDDANRDEDPPAGPYQGLKRKKTGKDTK